MADYSDLKGQMDELDEKAKKVENKIHGIRAHSLLDAFTKFGENWKDLIIGHYIVKVEGPTLFKLIFGPSYKENIGLKGEYTRPLSFGFVIPIEQKLIVGWNRNRVMGSKTELITGAKTDILHGIKFEKKLSKSKELGAAGQKHEDVKGVIKVGNLTEKYAMWRHKVTNHAEQITNCQKEYESCKVDVKILDDLVKQYNATVSTFNDKAKNSHIKADKFEATSDGDLKFEVTANANVRNTRGSLEVHDNGTALRCKGGAYVSTGAHVVFKSNGQYLLK